MRAVDVNVLLRYLLNDIPEMAERARRQVESYEPLGVTPVALAEVAWTLAGPRYRIDRGAVATQLVELLARENVVLVGFSKEEAQAALLTCGSGAGGASLGDALIAACARSAGVREIYSFDQNFSRAGLSPITPP